MTKWTQLHSSVHISGGDKFSFIRLAMPWQDFFLDTLNNEEKEFVKLCQPNHKPRIIQGIEVPLRPLDALKMYLCESMSHTFALAEATSGKAMVGFRSQKDSFKFVLKFPETQAIKVWDSNIRFYIRVADGDSFSEDGSAQIGNRRTHSINEGW